MLQQVTISFNLLGEPTEWQIVHNLHKFGLSIESAFENWQVRTDNYSAISFCQYIMSKDPENFIAMTREVYDVLHK